MKKIKLSKGMFALIDDEDFDSVNSQTWCYDKFSGSEYASTKFKGKTLRMHQLIMGKIDGFVIDHIDGNGLNNRRENLRFVSKSINGLNRKKSKNYYYDKRKKQFICRVCVLGKNHYLGRFKTEQEAISAVEKSKSDFFKAVKK